MEPLKKCFTKRVMFTFHMKEEEKKFFVNMDEAAMFLTVNRKRTVNMKGDKTVSIRVSGATGNRRALGVSVNFDGTKLPLFVIFKATPGGPVERSLPDILSDGMHGCLSGKLLDG